MWGFFPQDLTISQIVSVLVKIWVFKFGLLAQTKPLTDFLNVWCKVCTLMRPTSHSLSPVTL